MIEVQGMERFLSGLEESLKLPEKLIRMKLNYALPFVHEEVTSKTPVWTGESLRNWVWSMDAPNSSAPKPALGSMPPGPTNSMPLGSEPRRPVNQAAVDASFAALSTRDPFRQYWFSNNSRNIEELEYGQLPTASRSRNPKGMVRVTVQSLMLALEGGAKSR
jgi:hypothetical protein